MFGSYNNQCIGVTAVAQYRVTSEYFIAVCHDVGCNVFREKVPRIFCSKPLLVDCVVMNGSSCVTF